MPDISRDEFQQWMEVLRDDIQGVHQRLDVLNGRTRTSEQKIAVLEDRSTTTRDPAARWGAVAVGTAGVLAEVFHRVLGMK